MDNLNRRHVLSLGAALGLVSAVGAGAATAVPAAAGTDPWWAWDDEVDRLLAGLFTNGQVPAVNTAMRSWVNNGDPLPSGLPADLSAHLQQHNTLPSWANRAKLRLAADFNRRKDTYLFMLYGLGSGIMSTVIPREARSVYWSAGGADMQDRAAKTFTFGYDLSDLNAFEPRSSPRRRKAGSWPRTCSA